MSQFAAVPLSPGGPSRARLPDQQPYHLPTSPTIPTASSSSSSSTRRRPSLLVSRPPLEKSRPSFLDEILPTPSSDSFNNRMKGLLTSSSESNGSLSPRVDRSDFNRVLRRSGSVGVLLVFLLVASWLAATDSGGQVRKGFREAVGGGRLVLQDVDMGSSQQGHEHGHGDSAEFVGEDEHHHPVATGKDGRPGMSAQSAGYTILSKMILIYCRLRPIRHVAHGTGRYGISDRPRSTSDRRRRHPRLIHPSPVSHVLITLYPTFRSE